MKYPELTYTDTENWKLTEEFELDGYIIPIGFITFSPNLVSVFSRFDSIVSFFAKYSHR